MRQQLSKRSNRFPRPYLSKECIPHYTIPIQLPAHLRTLSAGAISIFSNLPIFLYTPSKRPSAIFPVFRLHSVRSLEISELKTSNIRTKQWMLRIRTAIMSPWISLHSSSLYRTTKLANLTHFLPPPVGRTKTSNFLATQTTTPNTVGHIAVSISHIFQPRLGELSVSARGYFGRVFSFLIHSFAELVDL